MRIDVEAGGRLIFWEGFMAGRVGLEKKPQPSQKPCTRKYPKPELIYHLPGLPSCPSFRPKAPSFVVAVKYSKLGKAYEPWPTTPSTNQSKVFTSEGSPTCPAGILTLPLLSLMGPAKT
jgi:hypothetical protein